MPVNDQGNLKNRYSLIPRTLAFLINDEKILLLKGGPNKRLWAGLYNGIGGHLEPGEDVLSAAKREFLEETGLLPLDLRICGVITVDTNSETGVGIFVLTGEKFSGELTPSMEGTLEWVGINQLDTIPIVEDLPTILPVIIKTDEGSPPFSAVYTYNEDGTLQISFYKR